MKRVVFEEARQRVPILCWADDATEQTLRQLQRVANLPYVVEHVCAMADAHVSDGIAVGTVFATENVVVPRTLGTDLGCGMTAVRLGMTVHDAPRPVLERIVRDLGRAVPAGDAIHRGRGVPAPETLLAGELSTHALLRARDALTPKHLGTLGGGNHFLEIDRDAEGELWLLVHSGSRGLGAAVAQHHQQAALATQGGAESELVGLRTDRREGRAYLKDLAWTLAFARENRRLIAERACDVIAHAAKVEVTGNVVCDVPHNFARWERWAERALLVHRKGAIGLHEGELGLVPGSMGTASYLVEGLGSGEAFGSCSHGAGRVRSRSEARKAITVPALRRSMKTVVHSSDRAARLVEEAPAAYRDITRVLAAQQDLVFRRVRLEPVAVVKGA